MVKIKEPISSTIRRMQDDEIACQMVLHYQRDPAFLHDKDSRRARLVLALADRVLDEDRMPLTVGEWVSVVMHYGHMHPVIEMRAEAAEAAQASYIQAERWLKLIDETNKAHNQR